MLFATNVVCTRVSFAATVQSRDEDRRIKRNRYFVDTDSKRTSPSQPTNSEARGERSAQRPGGFKRKDHDLGAGLN